MLFLIFIVLTLIEIKGAKLEYNSFEIYNLGI
jgi:hypothetical protein